MFVCGYFPLPASAHRLQYDLSASTYSPEGRIFQVEYAAKAVEKSGYGVLWLIWTVCADFHRSVVVGVRVPGGIVLGVEKHVVSNMLVKGANRKIYNIDKHIGMVRSMVSRRV